MLLGRGLRNIALLWLEALGVFRGSDVVPTDPSVPDVLPFATVAESCRDESAVLDRRFNPERRPRTWLFGAIAQSSPTKVVPVTLVCL